MKKDFNKKPGSDRFKKDSGGRSGRDGDKKPYNSDRPKRRDDDDRPKRSFGGDDKPKRSFDKRDGDDRPKRSFDNDRPKRSFGGDDKPSRSFGKREDSNDRPKRSFGGDDKPKRSFDKRDGDDRPKRSFDNDRPKRSFDKRDGDDRPKRSFDKRDGDDRPKRSFDNDRPKRSFDKRDGDDRPKRSFDKRDGDDRPKRAYDKRDGDDRPKRSFDNDRPKRSFDKRDGDDRPKRSFDKRDGDDRPKRSFDKRDGDDRPKRAFDSDKKKSFSDKDKGKPKKKRTFSDTMDDAFNNKLPETAEQKEEKRKKKEAEPKQEEEKEVKGLAKKAKQSSFERSVGKIRTTRGTDVDAYVEKKASKADDTEKPKKVKKVLEEGEEEELDIDGGEAGELMPLNKYISHSGECSRREAAELVKQGKVKVNGELVTDPGHKVQKEDKITVAGKKMVLQSDHVYILLNKPKGFITTTDDPEGRRTVMDLVEEAEAERLFPVGRLDRNTTGLLLMTNDGALAQKLSHPSHSIKKVYQVTLDKNITKADFEKIAQGLELEDGPVTVDEIAMLEEKNEVGIEIHSGRNRIVRRIFESLGYVVEKLDRVMYAGLTKKNLPRSNWRYLTEKEIILLKHFKN